MTSMIPLLDLYMRKRATARGTESFLTGRFGGAKVEIRRVLDCPADDPRWRVYIGESRAGLEKDLRARTSRTRQLPPGPKPLPVSLVDALSVAGTASRFEPEDED